MCTHLNEEHLFMGLATKDMINKWMRIIEMTKPNEMSGYKKFNSYFTNTTHTSSRYKHRGYQVKLSEFTE